MTGEVILELNHLKKYFYLGGDLTVKAVDDVNFRVHRGEVFGLVGESGCGKSTLGRTIVQLYRPTGGEIFYRGKKITGLKGKQKLKFHREMQIIFQDPYASLNPRMTVTDIIGEALDIHSLAQGRQRMEKIYQLLELVNLDREHANRYPHEFSGGQRQRIGIARALAVNPKFIVADEPISALDVSVQAQIVNLLTDLKEKRGLTYIFIAHDLSMVKHISDRVGVMYLGQLAELTGSRELYKNPLHPYTRALLSAIPIPDPRVEQTRRRIILEGDVPSPINPPPGCRFAGRCPQVMPLCREQDPRMEEVFAGHFVSCHLYSSPVN